MNAGIRWPKPERTSSFGMTTSHRQRERDELRRRPKSQPWSPVRAAQTEGPVHCGVGSRLATPANEFDPADRAAVAEAEKRFKELTGAGFTAAVRRGEGRSELIRGFDSAAEETLFFPQLKAG